MTLDQFHQLNKTDQYQLLITEGIFLLRRKSIKYHFLLYELYGFYVEAMYNPVEKKVVRLEAFMNMKLLAPYLEMIDISIL